MTECVIIGCMFVFMLSLILMLSNNVKTGAAMMIAVVIVGIVAFDFLTSYKIATSDMPDWMKFWLLR